MTRLYGRGAAAAGAPPPAPPSARPAVSCGAPPGAPGPCGKPPPVGRLAACAVCGAGVVAGAGVEPPQPAIAVAAAMGRRRIFIDVIECATGGTASCPYAGGRGGPTNL